MFTAKQLKEIVNQIPDDTPIVLQADDEGNSYRYMNGLEFIASGEESNFFNEEEEKCIRKSDFEYYEENYGQKPEESGFILCAVVY